MSAFTPRQRDVLQRRLELALCWDMSLPAYRSDSRRMASLIIEELESIHATAAAGRRAVIAVEDRLEKKSA